jgi:hypothetical protein
VTSPSEVSQGCHAAALAKAGRGSRRAAAASYGSAPPRLPLPTKISKTTPCKDTSRRRRGCFSPQKHFDTSGKSPALMHHRATPGPLMALPNGPSGAITGQKSRPLKLYRFDTGLRVAVRAVAVHVAAPDE